MGVGVAFVMAAAASLLLSPALARLGRTIDLVDHPSGDDLKIHRTPTPLTGGFAVVASVAIAVWAGGWSEIGAVTAAVGLALVIGAVDDAWPLPPVVRIVGLAGCGGLLVAGGIHVVPLGPLAAAGTVALALACPISVNLVDGQDGLAAGLGAVAALGLAAVMAVVGGPTDAVALGLALGGGLVGFLAWNRPPARLFLGDGGAYAVGMLLAVLAATASRTDVGFAAAAACLSVFAVELLLTILRRAIDRQPMTGGDRSHTYDVLAVRLGGRGASTVVLCLAGAVAAALAVAIAVVPASTIPVALTIAAAGTVAWRWTSPAGGARRRPHRDRSLTRRRLP
jgi:UDP-N-acetylmuramyl pentapeptide phosphotransferase/UDP-N-acetylglucosamine-1-phosphate transferase